MRFNRAAVYHAIKSNYSFALSEDELVIRLRVGKGECSAVDLIYSMKYEWTIRRETARMEKKYSDELFDYFVIYKKLADPRFAYIFLLHTAEGDLYYSENGVTKEYNFNLGYFNFFQCPYINSADVHREISWDRQAVAYQIFVDRFFAGGDAGKKGYVNLKWGDLPNPKSFAGGDLEGIEQKLDYLQGLGINTIYLTPVFESKSNHKYDIRNYFAVDPMFGGDEAFASLVRSVHARGMKIILDAVMNHCSEELPYFQDVVQNGKRSPYHSWFFIEGDKADTKKGNYAYFAGCKYMPKFNTNEPKAQDYLISIGKYWVEKYDIDGWRLDVSDEVSDVFWRRFRQEIKKVKPDVLIVAENWHDASAWLRGDEYDSIMNYSFTKACLDYLVYDVFDAEAMANRMSNLLMRNTDQVNRMMLNLLDSHDTERFYTLALKSGRDIRSLRCALAILYFMVGIPCIYYGTEIGMEGGYDPDSRRTFDWNVSHWNLDIHETVKRLIAVRKQIATDAISFSAEKGIFKIERGEFLLAVNNTKSDLLYACGDRKYEIKSMDFIILNLINRGLV